MNGTEHSQPGPKVLKLAANAAGRDFCVGDIHGMFDLLDKLLQSVKFDSSKDRLLSVGDLVDRGPASPRALVYLDQPWFYAIRGNHEQMLIESHENPDDLALFDIWQRNGGHWWKDQTDRLRQSIYQKLRQLPLAMEIPTDRGLVGIVHADVPPGLDWAAFKSALEENNGEVVTHALWSRLRVKRPESSPQVPGVREIYCGHNIVPSPVTAGNIHFIDTGAYLGYGGRMTLVDIQQGPDYRYSLSAAQ